MTGDELQDVWDRQPADPKLSQTEIESFLRPHARKHSRGWMAILWIYLTIVALTLFVEGMSLYGVRSNPTLATMQISLAVVTSMFLVYGVHLISDLAAMNHVDQPLVTLIRRRLRFCRIKYEIWMWMLAGTLLFLLISLVTIRHNVDGRGQVDRVVDLNDMIVAVVFFFAAYLIMKVGSYPLVRELKTIASDLEQQVTTGTERVIELKKRWFVIGAVLAVIGAGLLAVLVMRSIG